jgi:hypothetical protein
MREDQLPPPQLVEVGPAESGVIEPRAGKPS